MQFDYPDEWFPTKLFKPKEWERVITYDKDRDSVYIHVWHAGYFVSIHTGERYTQERITHWMRLPEPPREEV